MIPQSTPAQTRRSPVATVAVGDKDANLLAPSDEAIFQRLVHDHQQRLYRFIVKHIGWGTDAEDLTQQAFVEAANSFATFKGDSELSTWLYGIAMNLVRNYLSRAPHRRYQFEDEESLAHTSSERPDPSEQLAHTQTVRALQKALDDLPREMRDVQIGRAHV